MSNDQRSAPEPPPNWTKNLTGTEGAPRDPAELHWRHDETALSRFLGGSPGDVFLRLFFASLIVGAFLMWLDIRPIDIFRGLTDLFNRIWGLGFDAIREVVDYVLVGAAIVVPVWLALRLLNMRSSR
jgi:hypothetical protein